MVAGPLVVDLCGYSLTAPERELLSHPAVGGVILFSRNIADYSQLLSLTAEIRRQRAELLICVDQEGGRVQRCVDGFTRLPAMQAFDRLYSHDRGDALRRACDCGWLLAAEIIAAGLDFSFTPVLDVDDRFSRVIGDRSFSADVQRVVELAGAFIDGAHQAGMAVTGKHFPGHGAVVADSHHELPVDPRDLETIRRSDLRPFVELADRLDAIMPAHILFPAVDADAAVGFSEHWLQQILRQQLGFTGLVFSDDLSMAGAASAGGYLQRVERALAAGCDMALICNNSPAACEVAAGLDSRFHAPGSARREAMRASQVHDRVELRRQPRWRQTSQDLAGLLT